ncbi:MAG: (d)CMP kinase [Thermoplasmata archaeon]
MIITISGPPGSGKTTVSKELAKKLNFKYISGGEIFRNMAKENNMSIEEFSKYAERNKEIDKKIDDYLLEMMKKDDDIVVDSRLSGWLAYKNNIHAFKVYINANRDVRVERIKKRDINVKTEDIILREESEKKRYMEFYSINIEDLSIYDFILNTDNLSIDEVVRRVEGAFERWTMSSFY